MHMDKLSRYPAATATTTKTNKRRERNSYCISECYKQLLFNCSIGKQIWNQFHATSTPLCYTFLWKFPSIRVYESNHGAIQSANTGSDSLSRHHTIMKNVAFSTRNMKDIRNKLLVLCHRHTITQTHKRAPCFEVVCTHRCSEQPRILRQNMLFWHRYANIDITNIKRYNITSGPSTHFEFHEILIDQSQKICRLKKTSSSLSNWVISWSVVYTILYTQITLKTTYYFRFYCLNTLTTSPYPKRLLTLLSLNGGRPSAAIYTYTYTQKYIGIYVVIFYVHVYICAYHIYVTTDKPNYISALCYMDHMCIVLLS